jgi:hypothetical protein
VAIPHAETFNAQRHRSLVDELTALHVGAIGDWLYLPEVLYMFILVIFVSAGAGPYSFDVAILRLGLQ